MAPKLDIERIWWRNVQPGEFYNIERYPKIQGGGGSLYIEIPSSIVEKTLDFLDASGTNVESLPVITIRAGVIGQAGAYGNIEFHRKSGGRMRIARQNRQQKNSQRHPAWSEERGFPVAPDGIKSTQDALPYFPQGGLRIFVAKTRTGDYFAGHTKGVRPEGMAPTHPMWELYPQGKIPGGVIEG